MRFLPAALVALLYVLHQDFWFWDDARPLVFGVLPIGLFYQAAFTVACSGVLWLLVQLAWPAHLEIEPRAAGGDASPRPGGVDRAPGPRE
jgi:hypothetical protein